MASCLRPIKEYFTYRPNLPLLSNEDPDIQLGFCVKADSIARLTSEFRIAVNASRSVRIELNLHSLLGRNPLEKDISLIWCFDPREIQFRDNSFVTEWFSLSEEINATNAIVEDHSGSDVPYQDQVQKVKQIMSSPENKISLRFEVEPDEEKGLSLLLRSLPESTTCLSSKFRSNDVPTIPVVQLPTRSVMFPSKLEHLYSVTPIPPVIFGPQLTIQSVDQYRDVIVDNIQAMLSFLQVHVNLDYTQAAQFLQNPTAKTGNTPKYPYQRGLKRRPTQENEFDTSTGMFKVAKFGPKFKLKGYAPNLPAHILRLTCLSLATSTWDSYKTGWNSYCNFCTSEKLLPSLPVSIDNLLRYIAYLAETKNLREQTIRSYLSALKFIHTLNKSRTQSFDHPLVNVLLKGARNFQASLCLPSNKRLVMTWPVLKILGHALFSSDHCDFDKQVIWTACLVAYFGACRMGELLTDSPYLLKCIKPFTWERVQILSNTNYVIFIALPKCSIDPRGYSIDLFAYKNSSYCPLRNIDKVLKQGRSTYEIEYSSPVFILKSGKLLTKQFMNNLLKQLLTPYFPANLGTFSCHSFRAGVASLMASCPESFTEDDTKLAGRWESNAYKRYTRLTGIAQQKSFLKLNSFLS